MFSNRSNWTYAQVSLLWELARDGVPIIDISVRVGKTAGEIRAKAQELGMNLSEPQPVSTRIPLTNGVKAP